MPIVFTLCGVAVVAPEAVDLPDDTETQRVLVVLCVVAVVALVALVAVGRLGGLPDAAPQRAALNLPAGTLTGSDVERVRFGVGLRGYRMDQVDEVLDRVSADLDERDAHIQLLQRQCELAGLDPYAPLGGPVGESPEP